MADGAEPHAAISIHALLAESDSLSLLRSVMFMALFLSTLSLRRATNLGRCPSPRHTFLSTLSLRRATHNVGFLVCVLVISIHALLAESDLHISDYVRSADISIHALLAESDCARPTAKNGITISIHALLAESDRHRAAPTRPGWHFYPRSPCGERLMLCRNYSIAQDHFYPRSPCGERLYAPERAKKGITISIHALLAESDGARPQRHATTVYFYPRSPCGERRAAIVLHQPRLYISIHALLAESDMGRPRAYLARGISIHALLAESDRVCQKAKNGITISIHALLAESDLDDVDGGDLVHLFLSTLSLRRATFSGSKLTR